MNEEQITTNEILEILNFLKDNSTTKEDLNNLRTELENKMDDGFSSLRTELENKMDDGFGSLKLELENKMDDGFSNMRSELIDIRRELEDIKKQLIELEIRTREDSDASAFNYTEMLRKIKKLEIRVRQLEMLT